MNWRRIREYRFPGFWWLLGLALIGGLLVVGLVLFPNSWPAMAVLAALIFGYQIVDQIRHERD